MIVFDLACDCGCTFEGWFRDRDEFESRQTAFFLVCPQCGGEGIRKILSPNRYQAAGGTASGSLPEGSAGEVTPEDAGKALAVLQRFVVKNFEDVGADLATESLKIHYGVSKPRNIRGVTTASEEKQLLAEGINLLKILMPVKTEKTN